ncbi:MAG TPA: epimerase [Gammaproteobacteria bacterium]|nr:epimerase [Gammaproteobacteria bacterium]
MNVILFGATGMVGQGVLRECLLDDGVERVLLVSRTGIGYENRKLKELVLPDLFDFSPEVEQVRDYDACFFCLGVSAAGLSEEQYRHITFDLTLRVADTLAFINPGMVFTYVSGAGTDSSERGRAMWARVKGATENALLKLPFKAAYMFRPGIIQPLHGIRSKTPAYQAFYTATGWLLPPLRRLFPNQILTTEDMGRAMLAAVRHGAPKPLLEIADIRALSSAR